MTGATRKTRASKALLLSAVLCWAVGAPAVSAVPPEVPPHGIPLLTSADHQDRDGLVRIINRSDRAGTVYIYGIDDTGERYGPVTLGLDAGASAQFTSRDLETGNTSRGLSDGLGDGEGDWRLELYSDLDIEPSCYVRAGDGFLAPMHLVVREYGVEGAAEYADDGWFDSDDAEPAKRYHVPFFNSGGNRSRRSLLRLINPGERSVDVIIQGRDDAGEPPPGGEVRLTLPAGTARTLTSQELETGGAEFTGRFGDGTGKWQLFISAGGAIQVMNLMQHPAGHLANLSASGLRAATGDEAVTERRYTLPLLKAASDRVRLGFLRIVNHSDRAGTVRMFGIDDAGDRYGPITLTLDASASVRLTAQDVETGNASRGLPRGLGDGAGNWRLDLHTDLDIEPLAYIGNSGGVAAAMHDTVRETATGYHVAFFNPGSNDSIRSRLRLINPGERSVTVTIRGRDDAGAPPPGGEVRLTLPAGTSRNLTSQQLEAGGADFEGEFGDGAGKWQLSISADGPLQVMNLLKSPAGHLANLSARTSREVVVSGRALLGPLAGAEVAFEGLDGTPIARTVTSSHDVDLKTAGSFSAPLNLASLPDIVLLTVYGGRDLDRDNDGVRDRSPATSLGRMHAYVPRDRLTTPFTITLLTEIAYHELHRKYPAGPASASTAEIRQALDEISAKYLASGGAYSELLTFDPRTEQARSRLDWELVRHALVDAIHAGAASSEMANRVMALSWQFDAEGSTNEDDQVIRRIEGSGEDRVVTLLVPDATGDSVRRLEQVSVDPTGAMVRAQITRVTERQGRVDLNIRHAGNSLSISGASNILEGLEFSESTVQSLASRLLTLTPRGNDELLIDIDKEIAGAISDGTLVFRINGREPGAEQLDIIQDDPLFSWNFLEREEPASQLEYIDVEGEEGVQAAVVDDILIVKLSADRYATLSGLDAETSEIRRKVLNDLFINLAVTLSGSVPLGALSTISTLHLYLTEVIPNYVETRGLSTRVELAGPKTPEEQLTFFTEYTPILWYSLVPWGEREEQDRQVDLTMDGRVSLFYTVEPVAGVACPIPSTLLLSCGFHVVEQLDSLSFGRVSLEPRMGYMIVPARNVSFQADKSASHSLLSAVEGTLTFADVEVWSVNDAEFFDRHSTYELATDVGPIYPAFEDIVVSDRLWLDARSTIVPENRDVEDVAYSWSYEPPGGSLEILGRGSILDVPLSTFDGAAAVSVTLRVGDGNLTETVTRIVALDEEPAWNPEVALGAPDPVEREGHYYEVVQGYATWHEALEKAASRSYQGMQGYLATITSSGEHNFVGLQLLAENTNAAWLGASDAKEDGVWEWVTGPEAGTQFWQGSSTGSAVGNRYSNWEDGRPSAGDDDCAYIHTGRAFLGEWANGPCDGRSNYVVEYNPQADLTVSAGVMPATTETGGTVTISAAVLNQGNAESSATTMRFYVSENRTIDRDDSPIGAVRDIGPLAAGSSTSVSIDTAAPSSARTHYYGACVDGVPGETRIGNNCSGGEPVVVTERMNVSPTAHAGGDQTVTAGARVSLSGGRSSDSDGRIATYSWSQTRGTSVQLSGADTVNASFTAPNVSTEATLEFRLVVTDDDGATDDDIVAVTVRPRGQPPVVTGGVRIPDAALRRAVETVLGKSPGAAISAREMSTISSLTVRHAGVQLLIGLEHATNLSELYIDWNSVSNLSPLSGLTSLRTLHVSDNSISDLSPLSSLTGLTELELGDNSISNLSALSGLTNLTYLSLSENSISSLSALSGLSSLRALGLGRNSISNISALSSLTNLVQLEAVDNSISDISVLSGLTKLEELSLHGNSISNLSVLSGLSRLKGLGLDWNSIRDISALSGLTRLDRLRLSHNSISDISALSGLTNLLTLELEDNSIRDISPLVQNQGLGRRTTILLRDNPLSSTSIDVHVPALRSRGVGVIL